MILLEMYEFEEVRLYKGVPVYAPADEYCREMVFEEAYAFAYGEGIFVQYKSYARDIELMAHELEHVEQLRTWGAMFGPLYWLEELIRGYDDSRFEIEANEAEERVRRKRKKRG